MRDRPATCSDLTRWHNVSQVTNDKLSGSARAAWYLNPNASTRGADRPSHNFLGEVQTSVSDTDTQARETLERFAPQLRWVVDSVMRSFQLSHHYRNEVEQEARILLTSYADLFDTPIWGHGKLAEIEALVSGDEKRVKSLVARQLRIDLSQTIARQSEREGVFHTDSLDELTEEGFEVSDNGLGERTTIETIDSSQEFDRAHRLYPSFARNVLDGMTQEAIAEADGVTDRTVRNRIEREKAAFLADQERYKLIGQIQEHGLMVEGNETLDDLREAVKYLAAA